MKRFSWLLLCSAMAAVSFGALAQAQPAAEEEQEDIVDLKTVTCRDLLKTDGADRTNTFVFMYGYLNGVKGDLTINGPELADASEKILDACIDSPDSTILSVFEANR